LEKGLNRSSSATSSSVQNRAAKVAFKVLLATPRIPSYQPKEHYDGIGTTKNIGEWTTPTLASTNSHRVPFPSLHTNPRNLDAKHTPNPFTPRALTIPSHRMPFPSLHTACPPCTRIMTNLLEKTTQKWRISKRWRSTREAQTAQLDPRHMLRKYCAHNRVRPGCEVATEKADFATVSDKHARTSPGQAHLPPLPTLPW
jgi:hypothetical protein